MYTAHNYNERFCIHNRSFFGIVIESCWGQSGLSVRGSHSVLVATVTESYDTGIWISHNSCYIAGAAALYRCSEGG